MSPPRGQHGQESRTACGETGRVTGVEQGQPRTEKKAKPAVQGPLVCLGSLDFKATGSCGGTWSKQCFLIVVVF